MATVTRKRSIGALLRIQDSLSDSGRLFSTPIPDSGGRDCKERSFASTRGGVQAALAASRTLHRVCPDLVSRELWIGRGPETACLTASEQVFFNSDTSMRNCSDLQAKIVSR